MDDRPITVEPIQEDEYETLLELLLEADNYLADVVDDDGVSDSFDHK